MNEITTTEEKPAAPPLQPSESALAQHADGDFLMVGWIALGVSLLITSLALAGYHFWLAKPEVGFAVVDIGGVVKIKEAEFTRLLSRPNVSDDDRRAAYQLVSRIGPDIEKAVEALQKECGCTIVVKSAVIAGPAEDLTPRLKVLLGMAQAAGVQP